MSTVYDPMTNVNVEVWVRSFHYAESRDWVAFARMELGTGVARLDLIVVYDVPRVFG